ncbi:uncharacterized protein N7482_004194 [Penicillium canariense]|uniref:ATP-grasp domain-containing protein n=1 Tax=Penicillium canariense TaxID=189055 RepID=A0A9W9I649_9EURO|nr:uncharacterized protein N7482_004194 [Penicillium canariense]KAJ5168600.1 hypothetical protein N7482_004194 [Penicillium canariense]
MDESITNFDISWCLHILPSETGCLSLDLLVPAKGEDRRNTIDVKLPRFNLCNLQTQGEDSQWLRCLHDVVTDTTSPVLVKLILSTSHGFVCQSDFLKRRLVDCHRVDRVESFLLPAQEIHPVPENCKHITSLASLAMGAVVVPCAPTQSIQAISQQIDEELVKRLSFPWRSPVPIPRKRLALVGSRKLSALEGYTNAAASLNISIVVLDFAGNWIESREWSHLREDFIPFDMTADQGLPRRIVDAIQAYPKPIDGILTIEEHLLSVLPTAAVMLGLHTSPPDSCVLAQNKYRTRMLDQGDLMCHSLKSPSDLEQMLSIDSPRLVYPLIVKPSRGWASEGVWKVQSEDELREATSRLWKDSFTEWHGHEVVIEPYIEGPEIDANMVVLDGEILFFEVNDDFPSPGDLEGAPSFANFVESSNMIPSRLPATELQILERSLYNYVRLAGFSTGIYHIEARLRNSSCYFAETKDGLVDLVARSDPVSDTGVFLLEINPRPPGMQEINASARAYGVDYYSLSILNALVDPDRFRALSVPFTGGAQYHSQILFIPAEVGGIYTAGDVCAEALRRCPELKDNVSESMCFLQNGQEIPDPKSGSMTWVAFFIVYSRVSREDCLRVGQKLRRTVTQYMEECAVRQDS